MVRADSPKITTTFDVEPEFAIDQARQVAQIFEVPISYSGRTYLKGKKRRSDGKTECERSEPSLDGDFPLIFVWKKLTVVKFSLHRQSLNGGCYPAHMGNHVLDRWNVSRWPQPLSSTFRMMSSLCEIFSISCSGTEVRRNAASASGS
jgi:hypothetical protein